MVNQADHRAVGLATLDAVADAGNRWLHADLADEGLEPWGGVTTLAIAGSDRPTHWMDVSGEHFEAAVHSLEAHEAYNSALPDTFPSPRELLQMILGGGGEVAGVDHAVVLDIIRRG
jgi:LmbE family N-acetylglucosaminyl deacetylase